MPTIEEYRRLSVTDLVRLLSEADPGITAEMLRADVAAGAPVNSDGTMDLIAYAAWLLARLRNRA